MEIKCKCHKDCHYVKECCTNLDYKKLRDLLNTNENKHKYIINYNCADHKCKECCNNKNCLNITHRNKWKMCQCKLKFFDTKCIELKCLDCCANELCKKHIEKYNKCICNGNLSNNLCLYKKCKNCCTNLKCNLHFIQDSELSDLILNDYKIELYKLKLLPVELIKIINEFIDTIPKCIIYKYTYTYGTHLKNGCLIQCKSCNNKVSKAFCDMNIVCYPFYLCSKCVSDVIYDEVKTIKLLN